MNIKQRLEKLKNKARRDLFVAGQIKTGIPFQVRAMRDKKEWTQAQLGAELGMTQTNVSRLESPGYGRLNITTLQRIASVFDVALVVRFVPFSELFRWTNNLSPEVMAPASFDEEIGSLEEEFASTVTTVTTTTRTRTVAITALPEITVQDFIEANRHLFTSGSDLEIIYDEHNEEEITLLPGFFTKGNSTDFPFASELVN